MFTEYTKEEIEQPLLTKSEGAEGESLEVANSVSDETVNYPAGVNSYETKDYSDKGQLPYDLDGESLW